MPCSPLKPFQWSCKRLSSRERKKEKMKKKKQQQRNSLASSLKWQSLQFLWQSPAAAGGSNNDRRQRGSQVTSRWSSGVWVGGGAGTNDAYCHLIRSTCTVNTAEHQLKCRDQSTVRARGESGVPQFHYNQKNYWLHLLLLRVCCPNDGPGRQFRQHRGSWYFLPLSPRILQCSLHHWLLIVSSEYGK